MLKKLILGTIIILMNCGFIFAGELQRQTNFGICFWEGNTERMILSQGLEVNYNEDNIRILFKEMYNYGRSQGKKDQNRLVLSTNYSKKYNKKVDIFGDIKIDNDKIKDKERAQIGVGIDYNFLVTSILKEGISGAIIYELVNDDTLMRLSIRKKIILSFSQNELKTYLFYQPKLIDLDDYLIIADINFEYQITKIFNIFINVRDDYDSQSKKKRNDLVITNGVSIKW